MPMDVDKMQKKLATWSQDQDYRFDDVYNLLYDENWTRTAFLSVKENSGANTAGIDSQTIQDFQDNLEYNLKDLRKRLKTRSYKPKPVKRVTIPKGDDEERPLGIPTIEDRIVQESLRMVLEPIYETDFSNQSYGFRPNRSTHDAIVSIQQNILPAGTFMPWVLDLDIKGYFDNVDHGKLGKILQNRITDRKVLKLIWKILKAGVMDDGNYQKSILGTPQGGILSPLLANIYLNELDQWVKEWTDLGKYEGTQRRNRGKGNWHYVRYADDFLLMTNGRKKHAETMMEKVENFLDENLKLSLSDKKSELNHAEDGFSFVGYYLQSRTDTGGVRREIPQDSVKDIRAKIRGATQGPTDVSIRAKIKAIDAVVSGWANYYKYATNAREVFSKVQYFMGPKIIGWILDKLNCTRKEAWKKTGNTFPIEMHNVEMTLLTDLVDSRSKSPNRHEHPYLSEKEITDTDIPSKDPWLANKENRPGMSDQRWKALKRDNFECKKCGVDLSPDQPVHHIKPYSKQGQDKANRLDNLVSLCRDCHENTESYAN